MSKDNTVLGNLIKCDAYSGLPQQWLATKHAGMILIKGGTFQIGSNDHYPEERSVFQSERTVEDFWIDATEVTNAQFRSFIQATGYMTEAEQQGEAAVFIQPTQAVDELTWWKLVPSANWKQPTGPNSRPIADNEPVRMITLKDAMVYAEWLGREIPTEEQWEYAAKAFTQQRDVSASLDEKHMNANVWQGEFPYKNDKIDNFADVAPVGCFEANEFGLYDMIGNVWEYTQTPFIGSHDDHMGTEQQLHAHKTKVFNSYTIKGGSYLCASNYCARFRASARQPQEINLAISHVGFRTISKID
ncbi:formylglycine-generating enzyme family protein [Acinetobacter sp. ANC 4648]|uniref:formylglycine-generating enzyme family protein n=1 Tax=Acinetobacter sp. ANC 4648 TaxID=1977875 RepID=UPI000A339ED6|nr:formylglycine-generating enzyme family protein [Acinetobacter sp. ANC 4648]